MSATMRQEERVTPLELFFDLVFVLALTQCTNLISDNPTWEVLAQAVLILAVLWWSWGGYAWLTSVVNPEEGAVRLVIFAAMAAFVICALSVPAAFDDRALVFALAYGVVRAAHIVLFEIASRDDPLLRRSVTGLAVSTAVGVGLLIGASFLDGVAQGALWLIAIALDCGAPFFVRAEGWQLNPGHFAERHGLIIIIALGESIVAIGVGAEIGLDFGEGLAAVLAIAVAAALWWIYFDVVAIVAARRLANAKKGLEQNDMARDSYSYLHFPMVLGIVLVAVGLKKTLAGAEDPLAIVPAFALLGGVGAYLLAHVGFRFRNIHSINVQRLALGLAMFALLPLALELPAVATLGIVTALLSVLIIYETIRYGERRRELRAEAAA